MSERARRRSLNGDAQDVVGGGVEGSVSQISVMWRVYATYRLHGVLYLVGVLNRGGGRWYSIQYQGLRTFTIGDQVPSLVV